MNLIQAIHGVSTPVANINRTISTFTLQGKSLKAPLSFHQNGSHWELELDHYTQKLLEEDLIIACLDGFAIAGYHYICQYDQGARHACALTRAETHSARGSVTRREVFILQHLMPLETR